MENARFTEAGITFQSYPFDHASVHPHASIRYEEIRDVDPSAIPPEIRLRSGETLFVPALQREELTRVSERWSLPIEQRTDVWALLLEPYLDTEFVDAERERTVRRLESVGLAGGEVERIRERVGDRMLRYNAMHWDWVHLGLFDLLTAHEHDAGSDAFDLYAFAMEIADRGRPR
jgi:hypothetical protein